MNWTPQTEEIINKHNKDFNVSNYSTRMNVLGGFDKYVKSLGGVFTKWHGVTTIPKTVTEFRERVEYITGLYAIWGADYNNGSVYYRWGQGSGSKATSDAFRTSGKGKCASGDIKKILNTPTIVTVNCNYGVDTLCKALGKNIWSCDYDIVVKNGGKWITKKADLKPGDMVHFWRGTMTKKNWKHIAIVVEVKDGKVWMADFGNRFIKQRKPYHYMPVDKYTTAGGEYGTYAWKAVRVFNFVDDTQQSSSNNATNNTSSTTEKKEATVNIIRNSNFKGFNTSTRTLKPRYIVIHYTGAEGTAADNVNYFNGGNRDASADIFVGHNGELLAYNNDISGRYSWHCGGPLESSHHPYYGKCTNANSIGIELCTHQTNGTWIFNQKTVDAAVEVTKYLMNKYSIPAENVIRHYDVTGKSCPRVSGWGAVGGDSQWQAFKKRLGTNSSSPAVTTTTLYRIRKTWEDADSQKGAYANKDSAIECAKQNAGYKVYDSNGKQIYPEVQEMVVPRTLRKGSVGKAVRVLQILLGGLTVDGNYQNKTVNAVKKFQKKYKLTVDGVCGKKSWTKLLTLFGMPTIKKGSKGKAVRVLQVALGGLTIDGKFGDKTEKRLIDWQKQQGVATVGQPDGICAKKSWLVIFKNL